MRFYDSHLHLLEMKVKGMDLNNTINLARESGLTQFIDVAVDEKETEERLGLANHFNHFFSMGVHPNAVSHIETQWEAMKPALSHPQLCAIGEIGLDYFRDYIPHDIQKKAFIFQLKKASHHNLPVIIHNRNSMEDLKNILSLHSPPQGGIIHCYSGTNDDLDFFLSRGFYISFACNLTYKKNKDLHEAARNIPADKLLIETDAPYLAPRKKRGQLNTPEYLPELIQFLSELRKIDTKLLNQQLSENFSHFIKKTR